MTWREQWRLARRRKAAILELRKKIDSVWSGPDDAYTCSEITKYDVNELDFLEQQPLRMEARRRGIAILSDMENEIGTNDMRVTLTSEGEAWLRRTINKDTLSKAKDWVAVITPILSLLIAILGLLVALRKK